MADRGLESSELDENGTERSQGGAKQPDQTDQAEPNRPLVYKYVGCVNLRWALPLFGSVRFGSE